MAQAARSATATSNPDLEVFVSPRGTFPVVISKRDFTAEPGMIHWTKKSEKKDFKFIGFSAEEQDPPFYVPFKDILVSENEVECLFDPDPDWEKGHAFEYTIEVEFTDTFDSDRPQTQNIVMGPGDDKAVIRN